MEFSQRYAKATGFTICEARYQDEKNRQNSIEGVSDADAAIAPTDKERQELYTKVQKILADELPVLWLPAMLPALPPPHLLLPVQPAPTSPAPMRVLLRASLLPSRSP